VCCAVVRAPASLFVSTCCPGFLCDARRTAAMLALQSASAALGVATSSLRRRANAVEPLAATTRRTTASSPSTASKAAAAAAAQAPTGKGKSSTASVSLARQLYSAEAEAAVNDQINVEVRVCDPSAVGGAVYPPNASRCPPAPVSSHTALLLPPRSSLPVLRQLHLRRHVVRGFRREHWHNLMRLRRSYFSRDDVALPGLATWFNQCSAEERDHGARRRL